MRSASWDGPWILGTILCFTLSLPAIVAESTAARGLWVWKSPSVLEAPRGAETLRDFCQSADINEAYVPFRAHQDPSLENHFIHLIALLHRSNIRVEALLSSQDADEPGEPREKLLAHVGEILAFNRTHAADRFDGIHLDIEPHQRPENKGSGNLAFLPGLVEAYRTVRERVGRDGLSVNADIQKKLLKGVVTERRMLLTSLPRLTLMFYEVGSPGDGDGAFQQAQTLRAASRNILNSAYDGLNDPDVAQLVIALRTPDYGDLLPQMLEALDQANRSNKHYRGWARHSYNDYLNAAQQSQH